MAAPFLTYRGCVGQGGAGARGERARMETCRPLAGDLLHKQEICQSCENVRAGAGSTWCGQGGPDPCAGQGGGQRGTL